MAGFSNRVKTTTKSAMMNKVVDTILNSNVFTNRILRKTSKWSGETKQFPIKFEKSTNGGNISGLQALPTSTVNNRVKLEFSPKFYVNTVSLPKDELSVNENSAGTEKVLDLMKTELKSTAQDSADDIAEQLYGSNASNDKNFLGLQDIVDDGGSVDTYGTLSRATYSTIAAQVTATGGTLTKDKMETMYNSVVSGSVKTTLIITDQAGFSYYGKLLSAQERINKNVSLYKGGLQGSTGFTGLDFMGVDVVADEQCTSGYMYFLNEDYITFYSLPFYNSTPIDLSDVDIIGNDYSKKSGFGFSWLGKWLEPTDQAGVTTQLYLGGNLLCDNPKRQGVLTGITGV